jgi:Peptidase A4 family
VLGCVALLAATCFSASPRPSRALSVFRFAPRGISAVSPGDAPNWGGYVVTANATAFTSVTATWKQPQGACTTANGAAVAFWVGLGGSSGNTQAIEQAGTASSCQASGAPTYDAWYELAPNQPVVTDLAVRPGDTITASVNILARGPEVLFQIKDRTRKTVSTTAVPLTTAPDLSSAEWITESPMRCTDSLCLQVPLEDFGSIAFSDIAALGNGVGGTLTRPGWNIESLRLTPSTVLVTGSPKLDTWAGAVPSEPTSVGRSFGLYWTPSVNVAEANPQGQ